MTLLSVTSIQGRRDYMEDCYDVFNKEGITIVIVCDGHGGKRAAAETCKSLPELLFDNVKGTNRVIQTAAQIRQTIIDWGDKLSNYQSGSTLTGFLSKGDTVYFFNIGDSRTYAPLKGRQYLYELKSTFDKQGVFIDNLNISFKPTDRFQTIDHDLKHGELSRITNAGGVIVGGRLNGILSLSRALGDKDTGKGLSYIPDIYWTRKSAIAGPILLYTDGLYEPQKSSNSDAFEPDFLYYIASNFNTNVLVNYSYSKGSEDNMTAILFDVNL